MAVTPHPPETDKTTVELMQQLTDQVKTLVRDEIALAKIELGEKGKKAGIGAGLFGVAAVMGIATFAMLTATLVLLIALLVPLWAAALIVTVLYAVGAGVAALFGKREVSDIGGAAPHDAINNAKADIGVARTGVKRGRA